MPRPGSSNSGSARRLQERAASTVSRRWLSGLAQLPCPCCSRGCSPSAHRNAASRSLERLGAPRRRPAPPRDRMILDAEARADDWFRDRIFDVCVVGFGAGWHHARAAARRAWPQRRPLRGRRDRIPAGLAEALQRHDGRASRTYPLDGVSPTLLRWQLQPLGWLDAAARPPRFRAEAPPPVERLADRRGEPRPLCRGSRRNPRPDARPHPAGHHA